MKRGHTKNFLSVYLQTFLFACLVTCSISLSANAAASDLDQAPAVNDSLQEPESLSEMVAQSFTGSLRLTLQDAIRCALQKNREIEVASYNPLRAQQDLKGAEAVYDPSAFATYSYNRTNRPIQSELDTGSFLDDALIEDRELAQAGIKKRISTGGTFTIFQEVVRLESNSSLVVPDPQYQSRATAEFTQSLLQGLGDKENQSVINIANLNVEISDAEFRQKVLDVVAEVARAYWQLVFARDVVRISRETLDMAEEVHRREVVRLGKGISKSLDVDRALAAVETRRSDLIRARNRVEVTTDQLKLLLSPSVTFPQDPDFEMIPLDKPRIEVTKVDRASAIAKALNHRPELEVAQNAVKVGEVRKDLADHKRLPKLDAKFSYTFNGLTDDHSEALDSAYNTDTNSWSAMLEFEWPIGSNSATAEYRKAIHEEDQARIQMRRVAEQIAYEVNLAMKAIHLAENEIQATSLAMKAAERLVRSENARFELGQTTNEELLRSQDQLAANERGYLQSVVNYNISLIDLGRAQGTLLNEERIHIEN